jgi:hypothetical protein
LVLDRVKHSDKKWDGSWPGRGCGCVGIGLPGLVRFIALIEGSRLPSWLMVVKPRLTWHFLQSHNHRTSTDLMEAHWLCPHRKKSLLR